MAGKNARRAPGNVTACGECGRPVAITAPAFPLYLLCDACAAISILDGPTGGYRPLRTQEWIDVTTSACFYDLLEERARCLDRLTGE